MATLQGLYSAWVLDNRDPEGLARVLVRVDGADVPRAGVWARVATLTAGANRGTWFLPDVGDEVLVGFEAGNARAPYVIGSLWNEKASPPASAGEASAVKVIRSRSGVAITLRDDGARAGRVVIETPGGRRITLHDGQDSLRIDDASGNAVTMTAAGVAVTSAGTVTVSASSVEVNAGAVTVNAGLARFSGVVRCDTLITNAVVSASYTPGAGNVL